MTIRSCRSLATLALLAMAGCAQVGAAISVAAHAIPRDVDAAYKGLAGQKVVIVVWADRGVRLDNPLLEEDVAAALQDKLITVQKKDNPDALKGALFPFSTALVVQAQADHPEWDGLSVTELAAQFRASRLIYVEVTDFATRGEASQELFRGSMSARVKVVESTDDGHDHVTAKVAYDGNPIDIVFPKDTPKDGLPNRKESEIAVGTINAFADKAATAFYRHDEDRDG